MDDLRSTNHVWIFFLAKWIFQEISACFFMNLNDLALVGTLVRNFLYFKAEFE